MKPDREAAHFSLMIKGPSLVVINYTLDEYFEYDAEEFLVSLALLITEGRTPECSVKGRTESFHCPPAQSCYPITTKHECSDKLAQCRQARRTRSEVALLWKNNLPIMVEVMLLPDCCYSDDGPTTEGIDLNDPAIKQDALLLERWILEPVPRQSGDRFIEEKTLLLAVRSFVFFSQLSAWLSVSHGATPRNILYSPELTSSEDTSEGKIRVKPETPRNDTCISNGLHSRQSVGETNPLISSLLQERQDIIARIAQHLEHIDPMASHMPRQSFNMQDSSSVPSKVFRSSYEDKNLLKKNKDDTSVSISNTKFSLLDDISEGKNFISNKYFSSFNCSSKVKPSLQPQIRRNLYKDNPSEIQGTFQQTQNKATGLMSPSNISHCKENNFDLTVRLENTCSECQFKKQEINNEIDKEHSNCNSIDKQICTNKYKDKIINENYNPESFINHQCDNSKKKDSKVKVTVLEMSGYLSKHENECSNKDPKRPKPCEQNTQLNSIENYLIKDSEGFKCKKLDQLRNEQDKKEDPTDENSQNCSQRKNIKDCLSTCERLKNKEVLQRTIPLRHSSVWQKHNFHSLDGTSTRAFHPRTGLPLLSSPVPQRKAQSGCFDLDSSFLHLKSLSSRSPQPCLNIEDDPDIHEKPLLSSSAPPVTSLSLLGNFEESVLNYRLDPLGIVDGFTAEVGASGVFCPTHLTLPVEVSFYSVSEDNAPSPYMGVITLESLGKRGYRVPPSGTIQVTLFNPNKTVVKMFVVIYDLRDMPANHQTFLRQRTFSVPVKQEMKRSVNKENIRHTEERLLRYLIHLRFQSSKSGKIYLHRDVRLLFSRKSMEVDSGAAYELKSYTESPTNPQFSPRC
ncbi:atos homolog protein A isoform X6 [Bubalus kerabau]|uniref:atos homolog protein A isoform X6 n=1 Tax=Bubalus carabanensis TaxID=3119969 RepID=UPI00244EAC6D|nr:atos homolog protein A isoform X6 [Bubalus carabanensis]